MKNGRPSGRPWERVSSMFRVASTSRVAMWRSGLRISTSASALMLPAVTTQGPAASM